MKTFNVDELNKEDEIIERSIKDSNYYPENNTPKVVQANAERQAGQAQSKDQVYGKSPDIEMCHEASDFKDTSGFLDIEKPNDLQIRQSGSFIPPKQPGPSL